MNDLNVQIARLVDDFVAQVANMARKAAMETLESALTGNKPVAGARSTAPRGARAKGAKRAADEIEGLQARAVEHIKSNPGQRVEQINRALGTTTKDLALPLKKLIGEGVIRSEGERRATTYFPGRGKRG